jgi:hypothetical protein
MKSKQAHVSFEVIPYGFRAVGDGALMPWLETPVALDDCNAEITSPIPMKA